MNRRPLKILLVEPPYRSVYLPLGLQKIATYHLRRGDRVTFIHEHPKKYFSMTTPVHFNRIYVTSVFTYHGKTVTSTINYLRRLFPNSRITVGGVFASLMPDYVYSKTGIKPHVGLYPKVENEKPNYSLFPRANQALVFTSRGCVHNCEFCAVSTLVPKFYITQFKKQIEAGYKAGFRHFNIQDNNFAATPYSHQRQVVEYLASYGDITIDFNSGIDVRVFTEKKAKLLQKLEIPTIRFAFDTMAEDGYYQRALEIASKHRMHKEEIVSYVLWNFDETLNDLWYRIREVLKAGSSAYLMKYQPLDALDKSYIGKHWTRKLHKNFAAIVKALSLTGTLINPRGMEYHKNEKIGRTPEEFIEMLNSHIVNGSYFNRLRTPRARTTTLGLTDRAPIEESLQRSIRRGTYSKDGTRLRKSKQTRGVESDYFQKSTRKIKRHIKGDK